MVPGTGIKTKGGFMAIEVSNLMNATYNQPNTVYLGSQEARNVHGK